MPIIVPAIVPISEGADFTAPKDVLLGEKYDFRVQLIQSDGSPFDTAASTLTVALYNSAGSSVAIPSAVLTKDLDELGVVKISGITWSTVGVFNLYITSTVATVVRKFGPYKVKVMPL